MRKLTTEEVIKRGKIIYGNIYDYSKTEYVNIDTKITVICPKHGEFQIRPDHFFEGKGCPKCGNERTGDKNRLSIEKFIEKARNTHGNKYDYSKVEYIDARTKVCIICPKHGEFWQKPREHFKGFGCPQCRESILEKEIKLLLEENGIEYEFQKRFSWLRNKLPMSLDFYLPDYNIAIECQGEQHFKSQEYFNKNQSFEERIRMDSLKRELCNKNDIKLLYYSNKYIVPKNWNKYDVICSKVKLLKNIK